MQLHEKKSKKVFRKETISTEKKNYSARENSRLKLHTLSAVSILHLNFHQRIVKYLPFGRINISFVLYLQKYLLKQREATEKCEVTLPLQQIFWITTMGNLSNANGDGNQSDKKQYFYISKTTTCTYITHFCTFIPSFSRSLYSRQVSTTQFFFLFV